MRQEQDSLGMVEIEEDNYWGAQTERSRRNFPIGQETIPIEVIYAQALIKKAAAIVNHEQNTLSFDKKEKICAGVDAIIRGELDRHFPLSVWQTGSGTHTNMNVNELISNYASLREGKPIGSHNPLHPNDEVNLSQSSNDTFPSAIRIASVQKVTEELLPNLQQLADAFQEKSIEFKNIVKVGRTHLMDAAPLTLGQELSAYWSQLHTHSQKIKQAIDHVELPLGGTAVGTGLNAPPGYAEKVISMLNEWTRCQFTSALNKFSALSSANDLVRVSGELKNLAGSLMKIANDLRWMASGPRAGLGELILPSNEPGSSMMPGKVNPTQCESVTMVAVQVMGNDVTIGMAGSQGNFELLVYQPVIAYNLLQSIQLLSDVSKNFCLRCVKGLRPNKERIAWNLNHSLMLVTALTPVIGYEKSAHIAQVAYQENRTLKKVALALGYVSEEEFDRMVDPRKMCGL